MPHQEFDRDIWLVQCIRIPAAQFGLGLVQPGETFLSEPSPRESSVYDLSSCRVIKCHVRFRANTKNTFLRMDCKFRLGYDRVVWPDHIHFRRFIQPSHLAFLADGRAEFLRRRMLLRRLGWDLHRLPDALSQFGFHVFGQKTMKPGNPIQV